MFDLLSALYPWTKAFHIISVITWMAGIFYLPRLFVYHAEQVGQGGDTHALFTTMERKLFKFIMNPAMTATWLFGVMLVLTPGIVDWSAVWPYSKTVGVLAMTWFHHWLGYRRMDFAAGQNTATGRTYRLMNELPTVLMIVIVLSVVIRF